MHPTHLKFARQHDTSCSTIDLRTPACTCGTSAGLCCSQLEQVPGHSGPWGLLKLLKLLHKLDKLYPIIHNHITGHCLHFRHNRTCQPAWIGPLCMVRHSNANLLAPVLYLIKYRSKVLNTHDRSEDKNDLLNWSGSLPVVHAFWWCLVLYYSPIKFKYHTIIMTPFQ